MTGRSPSSSLILLPKRNRITELFVLGTHQALHHLGTLPLMSRVEELGFYLVGGKCEYKRIVRCCICKPPRQLFQEIDKLPIERFPTSTCSHLYVAIDFCGPFTVYEGPQKQAQKCWVMISSDLVTRFISVEVVTSMTTAAFINAFRAYVAVRGCPRKVWSDNGTNLTSGAKVLKDALKNLNWPEIKSNFKGFDRHFFPSRASSFAGIIEIYVRLFKKALQKSLQFDRGLKTPRRFNVEQFRTLILEAISLVNDRPLGPEHWDRKGLNSLAHVSPNKLVHGRSSKIVPINMTLREAIEQGMNIQMLYKHRTKVLRLFWTEFKSNYQRNLKFSPKWFQKFGNKIEAGTMIHYRDGVHMKPGQFQLGVVTGTNHRPDGSIKTLMLKTLTNKHPIVRDIRQCFLTEHDYLSLTKPVHSCLLQDLKEREETSDEDD